MQSTVLTTKHCTFFDLKVQKEAKLEVQKAKYKRRQVI